MDRQIIIEAADFIDDVVEHYGTVCAVCGGLGGKPIKDAPTFFGCVPCGPCRGRGKVWFGTKQMKPGVTVTVSPRSVEITWTGQ